MIPYGKHSVNNLDVLRVAHQLRFRSLTQGAKIEEFEVNFAKKVHAKYAVAVSSATAGLHISLLALNLPERSKVATSPISFVASANSAIYAGLEPTFVDVEADSFNMDPAQLKRLLDSGSNVSATIPVHYSGVACDMEAIYNLCKERGVKVVEDAAHALGARYATGEPVGCGKYSDIAVFSMHPVKSMTTGEGGMITTNDYEIYRRLLRLRSHGINKLDDVITNEFLSKTNAIPNVWYYEMQTLGYHYRLTEIQAALGDSQLKRLHKFMEKRRKRAEYYLELLFPNNNFTIPKGFNLQDSSHHLFTIIIDFKKCKKSKNQIMFELKQARIVTQVHYMPIPLHPFYSQKGYSTHNLVNALNFYHSVLTIPLFPDLSRRKQRYISKKLKEVIK